MSDAQLSIDEGLAVITFGRPDAGNPLTWDTARDITTALEAAGDQVGCVVLASEGPTFCAGADLALLEPLGDPGRSDEIRQNVYGAFQRLIRSIATHPAPVLAKVQGPALGAGADLALACDLRIGSTRAWLEESWIRLGTISALGGAHTLSHLLGRGNALDLLLTARRMTAAEAHASGIFQRVAEPDLLDDEVNRVAKTIAAADRNAVRSMKSLVRGGAEREELETALSRALDMQVPLIARPEFAERVRKIRASLAQR
jgi:enoyl-CoA hydratase/carnithine racemase